MICKKEKNQVTQEETGDHKSLQCDVCGYKMKSGELSWEEDDEGIIYCHNCRVERDNCGCSD